MVVHCVGPLTFWYAYDLVFSIYIYFYVGMTVESVDKGINGCVVKSITVGAVGKDGRIQVGDFIISVNNESMRRITNAQARAILRRASLLGTDIR